MLGNWLKKIEKKKLQKNCPHKYCIVHETKYRWEPNYYVLYCPLCDKSIINVSEKVKDIILNAQEAKEQFLNNKTEEIYNEYS